MENKRTWAIFVSSALFVSLLLVNYPVTACFGHTTSCEGVSVYQGDGGSTTYWYDDLFPPKHNVTPGTGTEWIIHVQGGGGCSAYEHANFTDNTPPSGWTTTIKMETITTGSFHYIEPGNPPVIEGDDIEGREFYIGGSWNFDVIYNITAPPGAAGGEFANMTCTEYVGTPSGPQQHDYVYVHCEAAIAAIDPPKLTVLTPNGGERITGIYNITWIAQSAFPLTFDILLSSDSGVTYPYTLVTGLDNITYYEWDTSAYPDGFHYRVMVIAFDGVNYAHDISDNDFTINNHVPDPPPSLNIHFGLTSSAEPTSTGPEDNTGSSFDRILKDDSRAYAVPKGKTLSMETFNIATQNDPVESAVLYVKYWVEDLNYDGTESVKWRLEGDITWEDTGITPLNTEMLPVVKTFDLFAAGVDTIDEIANLDISFWNTDGMDGQNVSFDYIWVTFKASSNDLGLTWLPSTSIDAGRYRIYRSPDDVTYSPVGMTEYTYWNDAGTAVDLNNYFYKVTTVDKGNLEGPPTYTVGKFVSSVSSGWNMPSTPLEPLGDTSVTNVLVSIDQNYASVQAFHAGESKPWHHWQESKPTYFNSLGSMDHMHGYYLDVGAADDLITLGRLHTTVNIPMKTGWNLIGYPRLDTQLRDAALSSIDTKYDAVFRYDPGAGREVEVTGSDNMAPGNGYWVHVTEDCTLTL